MRSTGVFKSNGPRPPNQIRNRPHHEDNQLSVSRRALIGVMMITALIAFELFNFDTTRYALRNLMGTVSFWGVQWAAILAIAFCAIDFAGLARLFTPQADEESKAVWYLMGAWLLGATMNAIMTWWAVTLTLLSHDFGNEVLSREQLLQVAPIFVATLVWLTRILFIGALSVAGEHIFFNLPNLNQKPQPHMAAPGARPGVERPPLGQPARQQPPFTAPPEDQPRVGQQPPRPYGDTRRAPVGMQARKRR